MKFKYDFIDQWVVDGFIEINSQKLSFNVTYVSDCLGDLLSALLYLNSTCISKDYGLTNHTSCAWDSEPFITRWNFTLKKNRMLHIIVSFENRIKIDTEYHYDSFLEVILKEVNSLIKKYGIVGYKANWEHEFPLSTYLQLKSYLLTKKPYIFEMIENEYSEYKKSDLIKDIHLLTN
ncbi:hypothetical protein FS935_18550 [Metabacillus litoralis]|uniref:Uncharacterized protein n=1 Tax=Metabacillus litoralis TaxID=152268 RepID=A0A5C6VM10_9BACI|nr:hypothetical protein [Metabacillus litoralis]TXC86050.1 hypothetical protein FS935_18550 [Metabacillus litoralis]